MTIQRYLLSTTALLGLGVGTITSVQAQALDVNVNGYMGFRAAMGNVRDGTGNPNSNASSPGFSTDSEVHFNVRGEADNGIRYGTSIEFEADGDSVLNTDEAWMFLEGGFGTVRFGDDDGAADNMKITGANIAAGTGGIDGDVIGIGIGPSNSGDATKIRYDGAFGPIQVGISYTPQNKVGNNNGNTNDNSYKDLVEAGVVFAPDFASDFDLEASVVGGIGDDDGGGQDFETIMAGIQFGIGGFSIAGGVGTEKFGTDGERDWANIGVAASFGNVNTSITAGKNDNKDGPEDDQDIVVSADMPIVPGVTLAGDLHFFDFDQTDSGSAGVVRIRTSF